MYLYIISAEEKSLIEPNVSQAMSSKKNLALNTRLSHKHH